MKDPYGLLGVRRGASREEIRHAYRKLVRVHHPDLNPEDPGAEERFKKLQSAYEAVLHDDVRRENILKQPRTAKTTGETNSRERDREFFRDELSRILLRAGFTAGGGSGVGSSNLREMDVYRLLRRFGSNKGNASKIRPDFGDAAGFDRSAADVKAKFPNFSKVSKESKKPPKPPKPPRPPKW